MTNESESKTLYIIGNGFDLACGLESSFENFFNNRIYESVDEIYKDINNKKFTNTNFLYYILYLCFFVEDSNIRKKYQKELNIQSSDDWMDIETLLSNFFGDKNKNFYHTIVSAINGTLSPKNGHLELNLIIQSDYMSKFIRDRFGQLQNLYKKEAPKDKSDAVPFYFGKELNLFEEDFKNYLLGQVNSNKNYHENAKRLFEMIYDECGPGTILNFNYTDFPYPDDSEMTNIHGDLYDKIIIGIDDKSVNSNSEMCRFTKTYRKLLDPSYCTVLYRNYSTIKIYGHSLGKQDYSYFFSIFDYLDIYSNKTKIEYVYSDYFEKEISKEEANRIAVKRLYELINAYGKTMDNKDKGRNLIHKMILEGRILVQRNNYFMDAKEENKDTVIELPEVFYD